MMQFRHAHERGHTQLPWLDSRHSFAFGDYYAPQYSRFSNLRAINRDIISPSAGYDLHLHKDMEIITYVLKGSLDHSDSLGNEHAVKPGDIQWMSCGTGIEHSEYNQSHVANAHTIEIWLIPDKNATVPEYIHHHFPIAERINRFKPFITPDGVEGSIKGGHDSSLYAALLEPGESIKHVIGDNRRIYLYVLSGKLEIDNIHMEQGDGICLEKENYVTLNGVETGEIFLFDLP